MHTTAELLDALRYDAYKQARKEGISHEDCVNILNMPDFFRRRLDEEIINKLSYAFGLYNEEEN